MTPFLCAAVGGRVPHKTELEPALLRRAAVYTDSREGAAGEAGPLAVTARTEVGEVVSGAATADRHAVNVFLSYGEWAARGARGSHRHAGMTHSHSAAASL